MRKQDIGDRRAAHGPGDEGGVGEWVGMRMPGVQIKSMDRGDGAR